MSELFPTVDVGGPQYSPAIPAGQQGSEFEVQQRVRARLRNLGYPAPAVEGILQNLDRESGFNPEAIGDGGTSLGLMQAHKSRKDDLINFAKEQKKPISDVDMQVDFIDHELKTKFPALRQSLMNTKDAGSAEEQFKRIYERPASVMWSYGANGEPLLGNEDFRFSPDSFRTRGDIMMMPPQDYLDLAEAMGEPNERKRKTLAQSLAAGEPIEDLPSLNVQHEAGSATGMVVGQDGRHRALAAQEAGLNAIPVEVTGAKPSMTELTGQQGKTLPVNYQRPSSFMDLLIPRAEAAQPLDQFKAWGAQQQQQTPVDAFKAWGAQEAPPQQEPVSPPPNTIQYEPGTQDTLDMPGLEAAGLRAAQELQRIPTAIGQMIGIPNELKNYQALQQQAADASKAAPMAGFAGQVIGAVPEVIGATRLLGPRAGAQAVEKLLPNLVSGAGRAGFAGAASSFLTPTPDLSFKNKLNQTLVGGALGAMMGGVGVIGAKVLSPVLRWVAGRGGQEALRDKATQMIAQKIAENADNGGPTAQDILDIAAATPQKAQTLADVSDPVRSVVSLVAKTPGSAASRVRNELMQRGAGRTREMYQDISQALGGDSAETAANTLAESRAEAFDGMLGDALDTPVETADVRAIQRYVIDPVGQRALLKEMRQSNIETLRPGRMPISPRKWGLQYNEKTAKWIIDPDKAEEGATPSLRFIDSIKQEFDKEVNKHRDSFTGEIPVGDRRGQELLKSRDALVSYLRNKFPEYGRAVDQYSGYDESMRVLEAGQNFNKQTPERLYNAISQLKPGDKEFFKLGAADFLRRRIAEKGPTFLFRAAGQGDEGQIIYSKLKPLFDSQGDYDKFISSIAAQVRMARTEKIASEAERSFEGMVPREVEAASSASRALYHLLHPHGTPLVVANALRAALPFIRRPGNEQINKALADLALSRLNQPGAAQNMLRNMAAGRPVVAPLGAMQGAQQLGVGGATMVPGL